MTTKRIEWEKDGSCWEIDGCTSRRLSKDEYMQTQTKQHHPDTFSKEHVKLTSKNAYKYIGYEIIFKTRGKYIIKKIISVSNTSIKIDHPDLHNQLQLGRKIFVILNKLHFNSSRM
jgi:hypothetical protein